MKYLARITLFSLSLFIVACDKPNPTPENLDPIYSDLAKDAEEAKKQVPEAIAGVAEAQKSLDSVVPQTGQIAYAKKRLHEAIQKKDRMEQVARYLEIRAESRLKYDREHYMTAWKEKKPWPDPSEYQAFKEAEQAKFTKDKWDVKARMKDAGMTVVDPKAAAAAKEGGEKKPAEEH